MRGLGENAVRIVFVIRYFHVTGFVKSERYVLEVSESKAPRVDFNQ